MQNEGMIVNYEYYSGCQIQIITTIVCVKKKKRPRQMQPKLSNPTMNEEVNTVTVDVEMESEYTTEYH
jgi:hypothetical protein